MEISRDVKLELIRASVPSVVMPLMRAGANHHFHMKEMEKRETLEIKKAETRARAAAQLSGGPAPAASPSASAPAPSATEADVYDQLARIRDESDCHFCTSTASALMDAERETARRGRDELVEYLQLTKEMQGRDITQEQAEDEVRDLAQSWDVLPQAVSGGL